MSTRRGVKAEDRDPGEVDVLVVGAGPTGTTLATVLCRAGVSAMVVDAAPGPGHESSRATTLHALTLFQLDGLDGAGRELQRLGTVARRSSLWAGTARLARAHWERLPGSHRHLVNVRQEVTEQVLRSRLADAGGRVLWGLALEDIEVERGRVAARLRSSDGTARLVSPRWLVGCDGAHSRVRSAMGVTLEGTTHPDRFLLADVTMESDLDRRQTHLFVSTAGLIGMLPMPDGGWRLNGTLAEGETARPGSLAELVGRRLGRARRRVRLDEVASANDYTTHSRVATAWRVGDVFLAGDAAHLVSPIGGQGMNLGIQDAVNLGWKLAHVARGWAAPDLLDTYEPERRPAALAALRIAEFNTRMFTERRVLARTTRNLVMRVIHRLPPLQRRLTWGPAGLLQTYASSAVADATTAEDRGPSPGRPLLRWLGQQSKSALDVSPDGPHLLLASGDGIRTVDVPWVAPGPTGLLAGTQSRQWTLVRPDGFIGWCGKEPDSELGRLLDLDRTLTSS